MSAPTVAVLVPTYRRPGLLVQALDSLKAQREANSFHVVIADNDDDRREGARAAVDWADANGWKNRLKITLVAERGFSACRNGGIAAALQLPEVGAVAMMDDDTRADPDWLARLCTGAAALGVPIAGGPTIYDFATQVPATVSNADMFAVPYSKTGIIPRLRSANNCLITRTLIEQLGPTLFDPSFSRSGGEDVLLFERCRKQGVQSGWINDAVVFETVPVDRCGERYVLARHYSSALNAARISRVINGVPFAVRKQLALAGKEMMAGIVKCSSSNRQRHFEGKLRLWGAIGRLRGLAGVWVEHDTAVRAAV